MLTRSFVCHLVLLAFVTVNVRGQDHLFDESLWKRVGLTQATTAFAQVTRVPHPENQKVSALHCEHEARWWGKLVVVQQDGDVVTGFVSLPADYLEGSGHFVRDLSWRKIREVGWVLQIFDSTHRGNGSLWLLELKDARMHTLMTTRAVADNDECRFDHGQLQIEYLDEDVSKPVSLRLHGTEHKVDEFGRSSDRKVDEQWTWDAAKRVFVIKVATETPSK